eukprot:2072126-Rhodomonas_salina.2
MQGTEGGADERGETRMRMAQQALRVTVHGSFIAATTGSPNRCRLSVGSYSAFLSVHSSAFASFALPSSSNGSTAYEYLGADTRRLVRTPLSETRQTPRQTEPAQLTLACRLPL